MRGRGAKMGVFLRTYTPFFIIFGVGEVLERNDFLYRLSNMKKRFFFFKKCFDSLLSALAVIVLS